MELQIENGRLKTGSAFKLVAIGYFCGALAIFAPFFVLVMIVSFAAGLPTTVNGQEVGGAAGVFAAVIPFVMLPIILAVQAIMFGGLAAFGLWLYGKRRPVRVVEG